MRVRKLAEAIRGQPPEAVSDQVSKHVRLGLLALPGVLSEGEERTVRDRIVHYEHIDAGTFNAHRRPDGPVEIRLVGGGEQLPGWAGRTLTLDETLRAQLEALRVLILGAYERIGLSPTAPR